MCVGGTHYGLCLVCIEAPMLSIKCLVPQSGRFRQGEVLQKVLLDVGLCGTATAWFFSQEDFRQGVLQKVLLDVRLQPRVSSRGDQSVAVPCVEQQLPGSSVWKM